MNGDDRRPLRRCNPVSGEACVEQLRVDAAHRTKYLEHDPECAAPLFAEAQAHAIRCGLARPPEEAE